MQVLDDHIVGSRPADFLKETCYFYDRKLTKGVGVLAIKSEVCTHTYEQNEAQLSRGSMLLNHKANN